jgi:hypothetical protein
LSRKRKRDDKEGQDNEEADAGELDTTSPDEDMAMIAESDADEPFVHSFVFNCRSSAVLRTLFLGSLSAAAETSSKKGHTSLPIALMERNQSQNPLEQMAQ